MISKNELEKWLKTLPEDAEIGIDDGGLILSTPDGIYIEMGGLPINPEDDAEMGEL